MKFMKVTKKSLDNHQKPDNLLPDLTKERNTMNSHLLPIQISKSHFEKYETLAKELGVSFKDLTKVLGKTREEWREILYSDPGLYGVHGLSCRDWDAWTNTFNAIQHASLTPVEGECLQKHLIRFDFVEDVVSEFTETLSKPNFEFV